MTFRRPVLGVLALALVASLTGCADKLTRSRFDMVLVGHAERYDVEQTLGEDHYREVGDMWHYERVDKHLNVMVHYGEAGKVTRKEWHDTLNTIHYDSAESPDDSSTYESTRVRTINE